MTRRTWLGQLIAWLRADGGADTPRTIPPVSSLALDTLPDRDSPSSIDVAAFVPLSSGSTGGEPVSAAVVIQPSRQPLDLKSFPSVFIGTAIGIGRAATDGGTGSASAWVPTVMMSVSDPTPPPTSDNSPNHPPALPPVPSEASPQSVAPAQSVPPTAVVEQSRTVSDATLATVATWLSSVAAPALSAKPQPVVVTLPIFDPQPVISPPVVTPPKVEIELPDTGSLAVVFKAQFHFPPLALSRQKFVADRPHADYRVVVTPPAPQPPVVLPPSGSLVVSKFDSLPPPPAVAPLKVEIELPDTGSLAIVFKTQTEFPPRAVAPQTPVEYVADSNSPSLQRSPSVAPQEVVSPTLTLRPWGYGPMQSAVPPTAVPPVAPAVPPSAAMTYLDGVEQPPSNPSTFVPQPTLAPSDTATWTVVVTPVASSLPTTGYTPGPTSSAEHRPGRTGFAPSSETSAFPVAPSLPTTGATGGYPSAPTSLVGHEPGRAESVTSSNALGFRVAADLSAGEILRVGYTLAAHNATDTASVTGTVTLTSRGGPVTIPATPVLAGRQPDVLTLRLHQQPGVFSARPSATLFLTPAARVGDSVLFEAYRLGRSPEAFRLLMQRHGSAVTLACQRILGNPTDAQDVSQLVFLELSKFQTRFSGTLAAWLRTVARHAALASLRARRRRRYHEQLASRPVTVEVPPAVADEGLVSALQQLPRDQAQAVRLRYLEGYTQQEAAELVGCPRGTLSRRAADGLQALRAILLERSPSGGEHPQHERH